MSMNRIALLMLAMVAITACKKKPDPVKEEVKIVATQLNFKFENVVDGNALVLNDKEYKNANGDTFTVAAYKYYISNVELTTSGGTTFIAPESYFLINEELPASKEFSIKNIPQGKYVKLKFLIGVDSIRNASGAQTGALDLNNGMFWSWNSGYIMAKLEGKTPNSDSKYITFHTGGYKGEYNVLRSATFVFPEIEIKENAAPKTIHITSDIAEWFKSPKVVDFSKTSLLMSPGSAAAMIADNYADMFTINHID